MICMRDTSVQNHAQESLRHLLCSSSLTLSLCPSLSPSFLLSPLSIPSSFLPSPFISLQSPFHYFHFSLPSGFDFMNKTVELEGKKIDLHIWYCLLAKFCSSALCSFSPFFFSLSFSSYYLPSASPFPLFFLPFHLSFFPSPLSLPSFSSFPYFFPSFPPTIPPSLPSPSQGCSWTGNVFCCYYLTLFWGHGKPEVKNDM